MPGECPRWSLAGRRALVISSANTSFPAPILPVPDEVDFFSSAYAKSGLIGA
jgi:hypothetical protein